jgi:hypothetical protein
MKNKPERIARLLFKTLRNPHLWIIAVIMALLTIVHYHELFLNIPILNEIGSIFGFGLTRRTLDRILTIFPIIYGTITLGFGAGVSLLLMVIAMMIPRVFIVSAAPREALFETAAAISVDSLTLALLFFWQKNKQRLTELELTQIQLSSNIRKLSTLHIISNQINQSLELDKVMNITIEKVAGVTDGHVAWLCLLNREKNLNCSPNTVYFMKSRIIRSCVKGRTDRHRNDNNQLSSKISLLVHFLTTCH